MNSRDLISMGIRNLWRRKARTFLTVLGVVIGTASIVVMLSLGIGMQESFKKNLEQMGSINIITVNPRWEEATKEVGSTGSRANKKMKLDDKAVELFKGLDYVTGVMPYMELSVQFTTGRYMGHMSVQGIDIEQAKNFDFEVKEGRLPVSGGKNEIVFGEEVKDQFYNPRSRGRHFESVDIDFMKAPLRMTLNEENNGEGRPRGRKVTTVGLLKKYDNQKDWNAYMDIEQMEKIKKEVARKTKKNRDRSRRNRDENKFNQVQVKVDNIKKVKEVQEKIKEMGFGTWSLSDVLESMKKVSSGIQAVLGGIGAVSLFVAALGITNTMIMSIYERTKEIGVMKVLGAHLRDIKRLFLFEAGLIGFIGGIIGIGFSLGISKLLNSVGFDFLGGGYGDSNTISIVPLWLIGASLLFSIVIGVLSGYYPARRAMKLSALEAIRTNG